MSADRYDLSRVSRETLERAVRAKLDHDSAKSDIFVSEIVDATLIYAERRAEAAEATLAAIHEWTLRHGKALCPRGADTYGEGMRDAKQQVAALLRAREGT